MTTRIAVVGVGALGRHHARILNGLPDVELVAVADPHEENGRRVAEQQGTEWVADFADLPEDLDGVSIAVPTTYHLAVASVFLGRGVPVMVEKPIALNVAEAERLVRLADETGTLLQVGHVERFNPATAAMKQAVGEAKYVRAERLAPYSFRSTDIGVTHDLMIHDVDLVLDLVGYSPVCRVEAFGVSVFGRSDDVVQARIEFENGCIADVTSSRCHPSAKRAMQIWSTTGVVNVDFTTREVVRHSPSAQLVHGPSPLDLAAKPGADVASLKDRIIGEFIEVHETTAEPADALTAELGEFVHCIRTGAEPTVDGRRALAAMRVVEAVQASVENHAWNGRADGPVGPHAVFTDLLRAAG